MKKYLLPFSLSAITTASCFQDEMKIWNEFLSLVRNNKLTTDRIRPHDQLVGKFKPVHINCPDSARIQASPSDPTNTPEVIETDNRIQYLLPWSTREQKTAYCFSFVKAITPGYQS